MLCLATALIAGCWGQAPASRSSPPVPNRPLHTPLPEGWRHSGALGARAVAGTHGMVTTDAGLASQVGEAILKKGGNAADAAIATAFALAVVYPGAGNLGGGGFLVARVGGRSHSLDFRETAPGLAQPDRYRDASGRPLPNSHEGYLSAGVPGSVAGLYAAYERLASRRLTWAQLVEPSIALAEQGFLVDPELSREIAKHRSRLSRYPASAALFLPGGAAPTVGTRWHNPDLAQVLRRVAAQGRLGFYEGPTAQAIAQDMAAHGGLITEADLNGYQAKWRSPLEVTYRGRTLVTMPPPSSGGVTLGMLCNILTGYDLRMMGWRSPSELHYVFEAMRRAFAARNLHLGDPDFVTNPLDRLLSPAWAAEQRATILPDRATPSLQVGTNPPMPEGKHTTHLSVVDGEGSAVAMTTTLNWWFGNAVTIPGTGVVLNNEMDDFAAIPGKANAFGLVQGEANGIRPGKRMLSSQAPTLVLRQGNGSKDGPSEGQTVELALGAAGGPTIITTVFLILSAVVDHGVDVRTAVNAPRFHHQHFPDEIWFERGGLPQRTRDPLERMGYRFVERDQIADAPSIGRAPDSQTWWGVPEPRREGSMSIGW